MHALIIMNNNKEFKVNLTEERNFDILISEIKIASTQDKFYKVTDSEVINVEAIVSIEKKHDVNRKQSGKSVFAGTNGR